MIRTLFAVDLLVRLRCGAEVENVAWINDPSGFDPGIGGRFRREERWYPRQDSNLRIGGRFAALLRKAPSLPAPHPCGVRRTSV